MIPTMINIFDITEKKKILTEYHIRLGVVSIGAVGALILASLILLIPSYIFAVNKYNNAERDIAIYEQKYGNDQKEKDLGAQIRNANTKTLLLATDDATTQVQPSQTISDILKIKGNLIKISSITYDINTTQQRIVLVGVALTRDGLAGFVDALKKLPNFTSAQLPISSYVKSTNIDFSIVLEHIDPMASAQRRSPPAMLSPMK